MIVNIQTFSDADFYRTFKWVTSDPDTPVGISLAGASLQLMVRKLAASATALIDASTANGRIVVTFDEDGKFTLRLPYSELNKLSPGQYVHSLIATWTADGRRETIFRGTMTHETGPTR